MHIYYSVFDGAKKRMKESIFIKIPQEIEKNLYVDCYIRINNIIMLWNQLICFSGILTNGFRVIECIDFLRYFC